MATGGGKPGITAKVTVKATQGKEVLFEFADASDAEYFEVGDEFMAKFVPTASEHSGGGSGEPENG